MTSVLASDSVGKGCGLQAYRLAGIVQPEEEDFGVLVEKAFEQTD